MERLKDIDPNLERETFYSLSLIKSKTPGSPF